MRNLMKSGFCGIGILCFVVSCKGIDTLTEGAFGLDSTYETARSAMQSGNFSAAIAYFTQLQARFPFSTQSKQAQLDLIYAYQKNRQPLLAIDAAQEFERQNPVHPRVDYALYMTGISHFDRGPNILERLFEVDLTSRPPAGTKEAFSVYQELIRRYPQSRYVSDTRQRMVFLRNRLAAYENHVAGYYLERGAYIATVNRTKYAIEHYSGAPELEESLRLMITAYEKLGMLDLADDARRVLDLNFPAATSGETI